MLHNPAGLFQEQAPLNPLPYVNIALQARARKQAREQAIDNYYQKLPDTINDKNVRDQEIPIINDYRDKIFEYGLKHKEALRNPKLDKGAAQFNFQKLVNEAKGVARLSQDAAKDDLEVGKIRLTKGNEWLVDDEEFLAENEAHNYPVTDPRFKKIDVNKVLQGRPFDQSKIIKKYADIKMGEGTPEVTPHPTDPLLEVVKTIPVYDDKTKETIYARAVNDYHNDGSFRKEINKIKDPKEIAELNDISMKTFGHPLRPDFEEEDAAAAFMVRALAPKPTVQKVRANTGAVMDKNLANQKTMEAIRQANREKLLGMREAAKEAGEAANDLWVETYIDKLGEDAKASPNKQTYTKGGTTIVENSIPVDAVAAKIFTRDGLSPDRITVTSDGKYRPIFYQRDADGVAKKAKDGTSYLVDENSSVPISKDQFKLLLGGKAGAKQLNKEMTVPTTPNKKTVKPKSNPLGLDF